MKIYLKILVILTVMLLTTACEKPEPQYILKTEVGDVAYTHFKYSNEKTKFVKMKKNSEERRKQIRKNRELRDRAKGRYKKQSRWDF